MSSEFCPPQSHGNTCHVVTGSTAILLDSKSAHVQREAYDAIEAGLNNTSLVKEFSPSAVRTQFLEPLRESLVISPEQDYTMAPGTATATVAIAAASISCIVVSIFCYGLMRRGYRYHPDPSIRHKNRTTRGKKKMVFSKLIGIKSRHRFVRLEESQTSSVTYLTESSAASPRDYVPSITWSISDITSDSASLQSNHSRTTSKLERIEEADEEANVEGREVEGHDHKDNDDLVRQQNPMAMPNPHFCGVFSSPLSFTSVEHFDWMGLDNDIELQGCRYIEDEETFANNYHSSVRLVPTMAGVDDLQVSLDDEEDEPCEALPSLLEDVDTMLCTKIEIDAESTDTGILNEAPPCVTPTDLEVSDISANAHMKKAVAEENQGTCEVILVEDGSSHHQTPNFSTSDGYDASISAYSDSSDTEEKSLSEIKVVHIESTDLDGQAGQDKENKATIEGSMVKGEGCDCISSSFCSDRLSDAERAMFAEDELALNINCSKDTQKENLDDEASLETWAQLQDILDSTYDEDTW